MKHRYVAKGGGLTLGPFERLVQARRNAKAGAEKFGVVFRVMNLKTGQQCGAYPRPKGKEGKK